MNKTPLTPCWKKIRQRIQSVCNKLKTNYKHILPPTRAELDNISKEMISIANRMDRIGITVGELNRLLRQFMDLSDEWNKKLERIYDL